MRSKVLLSVVDKIEIPWREIIGMRHRLVHNDVNIDPVRVWEVVRQDISALIPLLEPLVPPDEPG